MADNDSIIKVLIADDHAMTRKGLSLFLLTSDRFHVVGEAANGQDAIKLCYQNRPDIVLMDIVMPHTDGILAIKHIKEKFPDTQIIAMSSFVKEELIQKALLYGAESFVQKDVTAKDLIALMLSVVNQEHAKKILVDFADMELTGREMDVLKLVARGKVNNDIADELSISISTVKSHLQNIYTKLDVTNRTEATLVAIKHGLIT